MEAQGKDKITRILTRDLSKLDALELSSEYLHKVAEISEYNDLIASYYARLADEPYIQTRDLYLRTAENVRRCHKLFFSESYPRINIKDVLSIPMCRNRFCANCQKILQSKRIYKFKPRIEKALDDNLYLYHIVFTVKSPDANGVRLEYAAMQKAFALLIRYLSGNAKLSGFNVAGWGFRSAIRAIEVTCNENGEYHPHFHCVFAFSSEPFGERTVINKFSYRRGRLERKFSENEVLLQKLWRACVDISRCKIRYAWRHEYAPYPEKFDPYPGVKLSKHRLETIVRDMEYGYSVIADPLDDRNIYEIFKYVCKFTNDEHRLMTYEQFKVLQDLLYKKRCVQCFGDWYDPEFENELNDITDEDERLMRKELRDLLCSLDEPRFTCDSPKQLAVDVDHNGLRVIYRSKIREHMDELMTKIRSDGQMTMDEFFGIVKS